jgi:hypothetical protein
MVMANLMRGFQHQVFFLHPHDAQGSQPGLLPYAPWSARYGYPLQMAVAGVRIQPEKGT